MFIVIGLMSGIAEPAVKARFFFGSNFGGLRYVGVNWDINLNITLNNWNSTDS